MGGAPREPWDANISTATESKEYNLSDEEYDGNRSYDNGTYGQSDYTVRERSDGTYDVYVNSDSEKEHSHDRIDADGNLLNNYHDYIMKTPSEIREFKSEKECLEEIKKMLYNNQNINTIKKRLLKK